MDHSLSRHQLMKHDLGAATLSGLSALAACGTSSAVTSVAPDALLMTFWGAASRDTLTHQAISNFQIAHKGIRINSSFTDFSSYWPKLNTQIAGGNEPDIIQMDVRYIEQFVDQGPLALRAFLDSTGLSDYGSLFAMSLISLIPILGFFIAFQKLLIEGIATSGLKG